MKIALLSLLVALGALALGSLAAQSPDPVVVQAVPAGSNTAAVPVPAAQNNVVSGSRTALQLVQEMQATNAATLKKQEAALLTLDQLQKAAEDIKIFSKRG